MFFYVRCGFDYGNNWTNTYCIHDVSNGSVEREIENTRASVVLAPNKHYIYIYILLFD